MNFNYKNHTHFLVISGSHTYGMATETSDLDIRGWCVPPKEYFYSYHLNFEQHEKKYLPVDFPWALPENYQIKYGQESYKESYDCVIYNLRKFIKLAADCNPSIIELLFINDSEIIFCDHLGKTLLNNKNLFLSGKARFTFSGYAHAQLKRIDLHRKYIKNPPTHKPTRAEFGLTETGLIPTEQRGAADALLTKQARLWLLEEAEVDKTIASSVRDGLIECFATMVKEMGFVYRITNDETLVDAVKIAYAKNLGFDENYIAILQAEKKFHNAVIEWKNYQNWLTTRNPARFELEKKFSYDCKHASHLVRLFLQCKEILQTGKLTIKDKERAELLKLIRAGAWTYEQLIEWTDKIENEIDQNYRCGKYLEFIPKSPKVNEIDILCRDLIEKTL